MCENLLAICSSRSNQIAANLERRLLDLDNTDLVAVEVRYQFQELCSWLESEAEIHTVSEIHNQMAEIAGSEDTTYNWKWLKTKIKEKYGDHVMFTEEEGKSSKVCFSNMVDYLINDKWYQNRMSSEKDEADRILSMVAKIILNDIRTTEFDSEWYPTTDTIQSTEKSIEWTPPKLQLFL